MTRERAAAPVSKSRSNSSARRVGLCVHRQAAGVGSPGHGIPRSPTRNRHHVLGPPNCVAITRCRRVAVSADDFSRLHWAASSATIIALRVARFRRVAVAFPHVFVPRDDSAMKLPRSVSRSPWLPRVWADRLRGSERSRCSRVAGVASTAGALSMGALLMFAVSLFTFVLAARPAWAAKGKDVTADDFSRLH